MGNRILCRLCKYSRCHCMTKHPAQYRLLEPRAIGQLSICDSILVFREVLCYLETINGVEADQLDANLLRRDRHISKPDMEANAFSLPLRDTPFAVSGFQSDQAYVHATHPSPREQHFGLLGCHLEACIFGTHPPARMKGAASRE